MCIALRNFTTIFQQEAIFTDMNKIVTSIAENCKYYKYGED
jgi:hypothetical protein